MDSRLELTKKQSALVNQLRNLIVEMRKEQIGIVADMNGMIFHGFSFYNESNIIDSEDMVEMGGYLYYEEGYSEESYQGDEADEGQIWYVPNPGDFESVAINVDHYCDDDLWFSVLLDRDERVDEFFKRKEKQLKLAPLMEKKNKLEKELERFEQAIINGEENILRLEEKKIAQEIIDEEYAKIASNKTRISELQKEFLELSKEIRKVKAIKIKKRKNVQNKDVIDDNCHCEDDVDIKGHYEDFIDEEKGEVISIWVEAPNSKK